MNDTYQPVYDAVRSRIGGCNVGDVLASAAREAFDIGFQKEHLQQATYMVANEMVRPSVVYRPALTADGDMWCALLGEDLQVGVAGFGKTPAEAMAAFDLAFFNERTPTAIRLASADTHPTGGDSTQIEAPAPLSGAVPEGETPK